MNPRIRGQLFAASTAPLPYAEADFDAGLEALRGVRLGCTVGRWASLKHHFTNLELQTDISALIDQAIVEGVLSSQEHELGRLLLHFFLLKRSRFSPPPPFPAVCFALQTERPHFALGS